MAVDNVKASFVGSGVYELLEREMPAAIGQTLRIDRFAVRIVGRARPGEACPSITLKPFAIVEFWDPDSGERDSRLDLIQLTVSVDVPVADSCETFQGQTNAELRLSELIEALAALTQGDSAFKPVNLSCLEGQFQASILGDGREVLVVATISEFSTVWTDYNKDSLLELLERFSRRSLARLDCCFVLDRARTNELREAAEQLKLLISARTLS